jgi:DNA-directed RNA polymerase subunit M/transcription elongation factor TFIIS
MAASWGVQALVIEGGNGEANRLKRSFQELMAQDFNASLKELFAPEQEILNVKDMQELQTHWIWFVEKIPVNAYPFNFLSTIMAELTGFMDGLIASTQSKSGASKQKKKELFLQVCGYLKQPTWVSGLADMAKLPKCQWLPRFDIWNHHTHTVANHQASASSTLASASTTSEKKDPVKQVEVEKTWIYKIDQGINDPENPIQVPRPTCPNCNNAGHYSRYSEQRRRSDEAPAVIHTCTHPLHKGSQRWTEK